MNLGNFFKEKVIFKINTLHGWTIVQFFTPLPKWKELIKDTICNICADNLNFDDYMIGPSEKIQSIHIHADLTEEMYEFLANRHGFTQGHRINDQTLLKWLNDEPYYYKKMTERQFDAFIKDFAKLQILPDVKDLAESNPGVFESITRFKDFKF